jgi:hypothetical protein
MGLAIGGGILAGAVVGGISSNNAANTAANAETNAANTQWNIFQQQQANLQPYYQAGYGALSQIQANMPQYNSTFSQADLNSYLNPGYQFQLQQGNNAVNRAAAASGGAVGGSTLQSLAGYNQNFAQGQYQQAFQNYQTQINNSYNRLASLAGIGQGALASGTQAGSAASTGIASSIAGAGAAQAGGQVGVGNAITGGIGQGINAYQGSQLINALGSGGGGGGGGGNYSPSYGDSAIAAVTQAAGY